MPISESPKQGIVDMIDSYSDGWINPLEKQ